MVRPITTSAEVSANPVAEAYGTQLDRNPKWALIEGSQFFEEKGKVHDALRKITRKLNDLGIAYTVVGGLALFKHGHRRFTEDVDLLVTKDALKKIHTALDGLGWMPPFKGSKHLKDAESGVKIEFLTTGDFPGDGKPKPVSFPDPVAVSAEVDGVRYLNLDTLIELKLASGMTNPGRIKDLADVIELLKILDLPLDYRQKLNPYVQEKYAELWRSARRRFVLLWRNKFLTFEAKSIDDMLLRFKDAAAELEAMKRDGVVLDPDGGTGDDYAQLVTTDPKVAAKYGMEDESEFWGADSVDDSSTE